MCSHMRLIQIAVQRLCAITDEEGNFLFDPEKPNESLLTATAEDPSPIEQPMLSASPPDVIFKPRGVQHSRRLSWIGRMGAIVIRVLGVDRMPIWFPVLLGSDLLLALVAFLSFMGSLKW